MSEQYRTPTGLIDVQVEPGDNGGSEKRFVHGLPGIVVTAIQATASSLATIVTSIGSVVSAVDGLEALATTLNGYTDLLESKLDTLIARAPITGSTGQNTDIDTTAEAVGSQVCTVGAWIKNVSSGTQKVSIKQGSTASMTDGWVLSVGEEHFFPCGNLSELSAIASAVDAAVSWHVI